jgi:RNA-splicing ligase RtcB
MPNCFSVEIQIEITLFLFTDPQGGLKLKIAALKVTKKTAAAKESELRKVGPVVTKAYGKEKPKMEKTPTQAPAVVRLGAKPSSNGSGSSSRKLDCRKKSAETQDGNKAHGAGRTSHRDKVKCLYISVVGCVNAIRYVVENGQCYLMLSCVMMYGGV